MAGIRQFDEEAMLEQALELFWQKGFANTTMQDLAAATGVQRGSLYNTARVDCHSLVDIPRAEPFVQLGSRPVPGACPKAFERYR